MILYHARPMKSCKLTSEPGLHLGTFEQACMREPSGIIMAVELPDDFPTRRMVDKGGWKQLKRPDVSIVYLNRYEGLDVASIEILAKRNVDALSDAQFCKIAPEAADSYIIFDPRLILSMTKVELQKSEGKS